MCTSFVWKYKDRFVKKNGVIKIFEFASRGLEKPEKEDVLLSTSQDLYMSQKEIACWLRFAKHFRPNNGIQSFPLVRGYQVLSL